MNPVRRASWLLIVVGIAVYAGSLSGPFIFDDTAAIVDNVDIRQLWPPRWAMVETGSLHAPTSSRPVVSFSLAANYALGKLDVRGYRVVNIAVHLLCSLVLFGVVRRTLRSPGLRTHFGAAADGLALACALLWMVHPLQNQCVNYIIQRSESIMALFYLLTLYCAIRGMETERRGWHAVAVVACTLGMGSKEVMVTAPVMVLLYDRIFAAGSWGEILRRRWKLYAGLAGTWSLLAVLMLKRPHGGSVGFSSHVSVQSYALNQCQVVVDYLGKVFWPHPLLIDYGIPHPLSLSDVWPYALILGGLLVATGVVLVIRPRIGYLAVWFFAVLAPTSSFVPMVAEVGAERRMYLPLAGLVALLVVGGYWALRRVGRRGWIVVALLVALLSYGTVARNGDYQDAVVLWQTAVDGVPHNHRAHNNLGAELETRGRTDAAIVHYRRAVEIKPNYGTAHGNLGTLLGQRGDIRSAEYHLRLAVRIEPDNAQSHNNLGIALKERGKFAEAITHYRRALELEPDLAQAHYNLGNELARVKRYGEAIAHYRQALELVPDYAEAGRNLELVLELQGVHK